MTGIRLLFVSALCAAVFAGGAAQAACSLDKVAAGSMVEAPPVRLSYRVVGGAIKVGQPFTVEVVACVGSDKTPRRIRIDARMPAHGHGMNYTPTEKKLGPGHARFEGLVLHMPGHWEISFDVFSEGARKRVLVPIAVKR
jgi:hypothetical protein